MSPIEANIYTNLQKLVTLKYIPYLLIFVGLCFLLYELMSNVFHCHKIKTLSIGILTYFVFYALPIYLLSGLTLSYTILRGGKVLKLGQDPLPFERVNFNIDETLFGVQAYRQYIWLGIIGFGLLSIAIALTSLIIQNIDSLEKGITAECLVQDPVKN